MQEPRLIPLKTLTSDIVKVSRHIPLSDQCICHYVMSPSSFRLLICLSVTDAAVRGRESSENVGPRYAGRNGCCCDTAESSAYIWVFVDHQERYVECAREVWTWRCSQRRVRPTRTFWRCVLSVRLWFDPMPHKYACIWLFYCHMLPRFQRRSSVWRDRLNVDMTKALREHWTDQYNNGWCSKNVDRR